MVTLGLYSPHQRVVVGTLLSSILVVSVKGENRFRVCDWGHGSFVT